MKKQLWIGLILLALALSASAQAPEMFRYQGRLVDGTNLVNATLPMSFKLYDAETDGALLYEDSSPVLVVDGLYATHIGDNTVFGSLTDALTNTAVWLELTVDGEILSPRERLVSVPYAMGADQNDTAPKGTIVLSETYPNAELEAQGYSVVKAEIGACWEFFGQVPVGTSYDQSLHLSHAGKLWLFPLSYDASPSSFVPVWGSDDGTKWTLYTTNIECEARSNFSLASFNNKLWLIGGLKDSMSENSVLDDVWCSSDGSNWVLATEMPGWGSRKNFSLTVHNEKLWLTGGFQYTNSWQGVVKNDVWWTADGTNWNLATDHASFEPRMDHASFSFNGKLYIISGKEEEYSEEKLPRDLWWTTDGISWICAGTNTFLALWNKPSAHVIEDKIYVSGGYHFLLGSDDGIAWKVFANNAPFSLNQIFEHDRALWGVDDVFIRSTPFKKENDLYYYQKD